MPNIFASYVCAVLDPLITIPASLSSQLLDYYARISKPAPNLEPDTTLSECRYRIDSSNPSTVTLPDSRILSYAQFGSLSSTARTVFFMHGWPGSRIEGTYLNEAGQNHNIRVVVVDRPGIGLSTPDAHRTILSHTKDIEYLAQHLKAETYGVLGVSGGGPYALACAKALPADRLKVVSLVCGLGPSDIGYKGMFLMNYLGWTYAPHYLPRLLTWWFSREPSARLDLSNKERMDLLLKGFEKAKSTMPKKDAELFGDLDVMKVQLATGREANIQGTWWMQDMKLLASDPGFRVEDIRKDLKVQMWYGRLDGNVPLNHGEEVARRLKSGNNQDADEDRVHMRVMDDDTHASIFFNYRDEILAEMAKVL